MSEKIALPEGTEIGEFSPTAYYDKHMDCIRVLTHDRSVTEHRLDGFFTIYECNHRTKFDPEYVGFTIKGVRHPFERVGIPLDGVYTLAELIEKVIQHEPSSAMSQILRLIVKDFSNISHVAFDMQDAA